MGITSDWGLADWVQRLIGTNRVCYASEKSMVDPKNRLMEMHSKNLTFNSYGNMEGIIVNTVSKNSSKGKAAIEWVVEKLGQECRGLSLYSSLDSLKSEIVDLKHSVAESLILPAKKSIEELQQDLTSRIKIDIPPLPLPQPPRLQAEE